MSTDELTASTKQRPILIGLFAVLGVLSTGMTIAFATGMTAPELAHAIITTPPCCTPTPPPPVLPTPPPVIPTPTPPPVIDTTPPCCTIEPPPPVLPTPPPVEPPPTVPPVIDTTPPCCTIEPPPPVLPTPPPVIPTPTPPPVIDTTPPCCTITPIPVTPPITPPIIPPVIPPVIPPITPPTNPPQVDVCPNIPGDQSSIPSGLIKDTQGNCVQPPQPPVDVCPNITGDQSSIPPGLIKDAQGNCVEPPQPPIDVCPNIPGDQSTIPPGLIKDTQGNCVAPPPSNPLQCVSLRASDTSIERGEKVTLSWKTLNATSISINQGVGEVTPVTEGSVEVSPNDDTTYVATVRNASQTANCEVHVDVDEGNGGGGGGGRSRKTPRVSLDDLPDELPFSFVYLDEIPYTGLELSPTGMVLYWLALIGASAGIAYLSIFNIIPFVRRKLVMFGSDVHTILNAATHEGHAAPGAHDEVHVHTVPIVHSSAPVPTGPAAVAQAYSAHEGFRSFAQGASLTIDDIVSGLSRESHAPVEPATVAPSAALPAHEAVPTTPAQPVASAPTFEIVHDVPGFIAALLSGNRDATFEVIRQVTRQGDSAEDFLTHAVVALDDAYRAKIEGAPVHAQIASLTDHAAPAFLEKVIGALTAAVDGTYSTGTTGVKLAVTRALAVVNG